MCGRFVQPNRTNTIVDAFMIENILYEASPNYNVAPRQTIPAVTQQDSKRALEGFEWGLVPAWTKDLKSSPRPINVRIETLYERPTYRTELIRRRCIIPASGFYEWQEIPGEKQKQPWYFEFEELSGFAGLYDEWIGTPVQESLFGDDDKQVLRTCTIITTPAVEKITPIHARMPVILTRESALEWLSAKNSDEALSILTPANLPNFDAYRVSQFVNRVSENNPDLIRRID